MSEKDQGYGVNLEEEAERSGHAVTSEEAAITPTYGEPDVKPKHREKKDSFVDSNNDAIATGFVEDMEND